MNLKKWLAESEVIGFLSSIPILVSGLIGRLSENPADSEMQTRMREASARDKREVQEAVTAFIKAHPSLSPERFGIPAGRYGPDAYLAAANGLALLVRRYHRHRQCPKGETAVFRLAEDGTVRSPEGQTLIPATSTQREVSRYIRLAYLPRPEEMTWSLSKALRQEAERVAGPGQEHARAFIRWLWAALRHQPNLLYGFRAEPNGSRQDLRLVGTAIREDDDRLAPWRIG